VFEFTDDEACLFRLQLAEARRDIRLSDGTVVRKGEPVFRLHVWNEHIPPMEPDGSDVAWGVRVSRLTIRSMRAIAQWLADHPELSDRRIIGSSTVLVDLDGRGGSAHLMQRLGFDIFPYRNGLGRFGEFWQNLYAWGLMWTFNEASARDKSPFRMRRTEVWMSTDALRMSYGRVPTTPARQCESAPGGVGR
jgi:hypothetical protein